MNNVTVILTPEMAEQYIAFAQAGAITLERAVNKALDEWMEETGRFLYDALKKRRAANPETVTA